MKTPVYMDYQATTPVDPAVWRAMEPYFTQYFGNAASKSHTFGLQAEAAVQVAREQVAQALGAEPQEIIFTSGATESNNMALLGVARALASQGNHLITVQTEHKAVLDPCAALEQEGFEITYLPVDEAGRLDLEQLQQAIRPDTLLISVMAANNEIGTLVPLQAIGKIAQQAGVLFHTDAAQAVGKIPLNTEGIDLLSISGHKLYGPKGIGAFYVRKRTPRLPLQPLLFGGGHERGLRSGTLNIPGVVGLGAAVQLALEKMPEESKRLMGLRNRLYETLQQNLPGVQLNGSLEDRLPHNLNLSFEGVRSETLMMELRDVAVSSGSACTSANPEPSHVLKALGLGQARIRASIRFGLGRPTTEDEVDYVAGRVIEVVKKIRD